MKIACLSDIHGFLPQIPGCDLLILAGDYCIGGDRFTQLSNYHKLCEWINYLHSDRGIDIIGVAGNHDRLFEKPGYHGLSHPQWTYLQDSGCKWRGFNVWGSPWQPRFFDWAFNLDEPDLAKKWELIPDDTDILITHGPPEGIGDFSSYGKERIGSPSLRKRIEAIKPKLCVYGHNHEGYGTYRLGETVCVNASFVDIKYNPVNPIQVVNL